MFDVSKLTWLNGKYLRRLSPQQLLDRLRGQLLSDAHLLEVLPLVQERIDTLEGFFDYSGFFFTGEIAYDAEARHAMVPKGRTPADTQKLLKTLVEEELDLVLDWRKETLETAIRRFVGEVRLARGRAIHDAACRDHGAGRVAASLRDARRPRQGDLPAEAAARR